MYDDVLYEYASNTINTCLKWSKSFLRMKNHDFFLSSIMSWKIPLSHFCNLESRNQIISALGYFKSYIFPILFWLAQICPRFPVVLHHSFAKENGVIKKKEVSYTHSATAMCREQHKSTYIMKYYIYYSHLVLNVSIDDW